MGRPVLHRRGDEDDGFAELDQAGPVRETGHAADFEDEFSAGEPAFDSFNHDVFFQGMPPASGGELAGGDHRPSAEHAVSPERRRNRRVRGVQGASKRGAAGVSATGCE